MKSLQIKLGGGVYSCARNLLTEASALAKVGWHVRANIKDESELAVARFHGGRSAAAATAATSLHFEAI